MIFCKKNFLKTPFKPLTNAQTKYILWAKSEREEKIFRKDNLIEEVSAVKTIWLAFKQYVRKNGLYVKFF